MATTLQQLLDALTEQASAATKSTSIEDVTGALAHLGRALTGLTHDGLTPAASPRQRTVAELGAACSTAGRLWPPTGGPLTDLAGAAADLIGRDRAVLGRAHRWATSVELAEAADTCARLGRRLLPRAAVTEFTAVRRLAAAVERDAQTAPPTPAAAAVLDRLMPMPDAWSTASPVTGTDACGALAAALGRAQRADELTLREFRATVAAAIIGSRSAAAVTAATTGREAGPLLITAAAWQAAGRTSMVFEDGRRASPADPRGVVACAHALAGVLRADIGPHADISALRDRDDLPSLAGRVQQVANQLPVLADQLAAAVDRWSRNGRLYANARHLPPMEDMPEDRVHAVIGGRHVRAVGPDLNRLRHAVDRAGALSAALADTLNRAISARPSEYPEPARVHAERIRTARGANRRLTHGQAVEHGLPGNRIPSNWASSVPDGPGSPSR